MTNKARHVIGEVNAECPPSWHSATWGNWGVSSNFGGLADSDQFRGFHLSGTQGQWNSCTRDHLRDTDNIYYNHDHNGNGLGDDQWQDGDYWCANGSVDLNRGCPVDMNLDGRCDRGGCVGLTSFTVSNQFLSLYELDWPDGDEFITTLYVDSGCCKAVLSGCTKYGCTGPFYSAYYSTIQSTNTAVEAKVRLKVNYAVFVDVDNYCANQPGRQFRCH